MKRALLTLLLFTGPLWGQTVKLPAEVKVQPGRLASVTVEWDGDAVDYLAPPDLDVFREYDPDPKRVRLRMIGYATGRHTLFVAVAKAGKLAVAQCSIVVGTPGPPVPPVPPDPDPVKVTVPSVVGNDYAMALVALRAVGLSVDVVGPVNGTVAQQNPAAGAKAAKGDVVTLTMTADPPPSPAPIPLPGFRVLIVEETAQRGKLTAGQHSAILGKTVRDYLNAKCVKEGMQAGYWILDKDVAVDQLPKHWQDAWKRQRASLPWLLVSNGTSGFEGPLPESLDDTLKLLAKYAEGK